MTHRLNWIASLMGSLWATLASAQVIDDQASVDSGARALRGGGYPWYDASTEELRRIEQPTDWWWWLEWLDFGNWGFGIGTFARQLLITSLF